MMIVYIENRLKIHCYTTILLLLCYVSISKTRENVWPTKTASCDGQVYVSEAQVMTNSHRTWQVTHSTHDSHSFHFIIFLTKMFFPFSNVLSVFPIFPPVLSRLTRPLTRFNDDCREMLFISQSWLYASVFPNLTRFLRRYKSYRWIRATSHKTPPKKEFSAETWRKHPRLSLLNLFQFSVFSVQVLCEWKHSESWCILEIAGLGASPCLHEVVVICHNTVW